MFTSERDTMHKKTQVTYGISVGIMQMYRILMVLDNVGHDATMRKLKAWYQSQRIIAGVDTND